MEKMIRFFVSGCTALFGMVLLLGCCSQRGGEKTQSMQIPQVVSVVNPNEVIVCFGDSLTAGMGAGGPNVEDRSKSYPAYLQEKVNVPVVNAGISGETTTDALFRMNRDVLSLSPQVVLVEFGGNDFLSQIDLAITSHNLGVLLSNLADGSRKVYLIKFYNQESIAQIIASAGLGEREQREIINRYNAMYQQLAGMYKIEIIDSFWNGAWGAYMSDSIHANARGYELMAVNIFHAMQPYLEAKGMVRYTR
jgi:acyl-CoA thioesterase-1